MKDKNDILFHIDLFFCFFQTDTIFDAIMIRIITVFMILDKLTVISAINSTKLDVSPSLVSKKYLNIIIMYVHGGVNLRTLHVMHNYSLYVVL